jgi:putative copper export protein
MNSPLLELALGVNRVVLYIGYVLLAGTLTFWTLVWPDGQVDRRLVLMTWLGTALMTVATVTALVIGMVMNGRTYSDVVSPLNGAALIVRLAGLAFMAFFLVDVARSEIIGWRRVVAVGVVTLVAATMVVHSDAATGPWWAVKIVAASGHVLATAAWLGGLVALAMVLIQRENLRELDWLIPRFSLVATVSVIILVLTGSIHALAAAGGIGPLLSSRYGLVLLIKVVVVGLLLLLGKYSRRYATRVAFRRVNPMAASINKERIRTLTVVMGAEVAIAVVVLATTSVLVLAAPAL